MSKHASKHGAKLSMMGSIAVLLVVALTGFLFVTNLRVNRTATVTSDTADLIEQRVQEVNKLQEDVNKLSADVNTMTELASKDNTSSKTTDDPGIGTTLPAVEGPGVTVTLNDSPMWEQAIDASGSSDDIDKYVIHQQDIEAVVNALWAGGAEAMMLMDQRVLFNSAVICSGNVVSLHGKKYSPPFTISAIGDPDALIQALNASPTIKIYKQYVSSFGLGWKVERKKSLHFEETAALLQPLKYAKVSGKTEEDTDTLESSDSSGSDSSVDADNADASDSSNTGEESKGGN